MLIRTLTVIGGANAFTPGLVEALLDNSDKLRLREVRLFDVDTHRLGIVLRLCQAMARAEESPFRVIGEGDLCEAVRGADAVLNSARPGGFHCRRIDETLPLEFDLPGHENVGPGSFFFALRSVAQAKELGRAMEDHAPNSILLNYTNPTNIVTQALLHTTPLPVVGLCDQADDDLRTLAEACGYHATDIAYRCNGLHDATWYTDIQFDGVRFRFDHETPQLPESLDEERRMRFEVCWEMARRHPGQWPNSYLAYYERPELFVALSRRIGPRTDMIVQDLDAHYERFAREALRARPDLGRYRRTSALGDQAVRAIVALGADRSRPLTLNIKNATATHQLDSETVIETVVDVDRWGVHKSGAPELPEDRVGQVRTLERYQRATAQVAANGKHEALVDALAANPLVQDRKKADAILRRARQVYGSHIAALSSVDEGQVSK